MFTILYVCFAHFNFPSFINPHFLFTLTLLPLIWQVLCAVVSSSSIASFPLMPLPSSHIFRPGPSSTPCSGDIVFYLVCWVTFNGAGGWGVVWCSCSPAVYHPTVRDVVCLLVRFYHICGVSWVSCWSAYNSFLQSIDILVFIHKCVFQCITANTLKQAC